MIELEKIERARMYMYKLANGINPLDDSVIPESDIVNNVRLSRCFFYVSSILDQVIEKENAAANNKTLKTPFAISEEKLKLFEYSDEPIPVSAIAKRLNVLIDTDAMAQLKYRSILSWLLDINMLEIVAGPSGNDVKRPTVQGQEHGISIERRTTPSGTYDLVIYNRNAQQFILNNMKTIAEYNIKSQSKTPELQGQPWSQAHDECLTDLFYKGVPVSEIAITLKRTQTGVRARLKRLGLVEKE